MKRLRSVVVSAVISLALVGVGPSMVSATTTCKATDANFEYQDTLDNTVMTVTLHVKGCYTGTTSYGTSLRLTFWSTLWYLGSPKPEPGFQTDANHGITLFGGHPVFHMGAGLALVTAPLVQLSKSGSWTIYDNVARVCDDGMTGLIGFNTTIYGPDSPDSTQIGAVDVQPSAGTTIYCAEFSQFQPVLIGRYLSAYT